MPAPDALPDTARAAAWRALWDHLVLEALRELDPSDEPVENDGTPDEVAARHANRLALASGHRAIAGVEM